MKADIHPTYNAVVFRDLASGATFLTRSTVSSDKTIEPTARPTRSSTSRSRRSRTRSTGKQRIMDSAGRVEKFNKRFKGFGA